jgi:hypothetical protein
MTCGCRRAPGTGELAGAADGECTAGTDAEAVDAPLAGGREESHPALTVASVSKMTATGIRIHERDFANIPQS